LTAALLALGALATNADFVVTSTRSPGSGPTAGMDLIKFFAFNSGANGTGTDLQSVDVTLAVQGPGWPGSENPLKFRLIDIDDDGIDDVDLFLRGPGSSTSNPQGTYVRIGGSASWNVVLFPAGLTSAVDDPPPNRPPPAEIYANVKSVRVAGFNLEAVPANTGTQWMRGAGAQFAAIVVPKGTWVMASGGVAGKQGGITNFIEFNPLMPEPATAGVFGVAATALLRRRGR
jgi:hypothetical protein